MVVVAVLVVLCATVTMAVASSSIFGSAQTAKDRSRLQALAAAEAGRDSLLAALQTSPSTCPATRTAAGSVGSATYTAAATWAAAPSSTTSDSTCPSDGTIRITATGTAADGTTKTVVASYPYRAAALVRTTTTATATATATATVAGTTTVATANGAIIEGNRSAGNALNIPTVVVNDGDLVVASAGTFDCNSDSVIDGDLVVPNGSVSLSNQCRVAGSVYAKGDIDINNLGNHVGADVVSTNGDVSINTGSVNGNVSAGGTVAIQNDVTIGKSVTAAGTGPSSFYDATVNGSVSVGGTFASFQTMTVGGNVTAAGTGTSHVAPDTTITGDLTLGGPISTWSTGPVVKGRKRYSVAGLAAPVVATPSAMTRSTWLEIPWKSAAWTNAGWTVKTATAAECNYQNNATLVATVNALTKPTVIDATACGAAGVNLYGATFALKTHVAFIAQAFQSAQNVVVGVSGTGTRLFDLIVPDATSTDGVPTCPSGATVSSIYAARLGAGVSGIAYSPCTIQFGRASWTGQIIAGYPDPAGGNVTLGYQNIGIPGATSTTSTGATATLSAISTTTTTTKVTTTTTATVSTSPTMAPSLIQQTEP